MARPFSGGSRLSTRSLGVSLVVCPNDENSELAPTEKSWTCLAVISVCFLWCLVKNRMMTAVDISKVDVELQCLLFVLG